MEQQTAPTAAPDTSAPNTATPPAAAPAQPATTPDQDPSWLAGRLERERKAILKELGVDSADDVKKALADLKAKREAEKTETQKTAELIADLKRKEERLSSLETAVSVKAKNELALLTETQRKAVEALAPDNDPALVLGAIEALKPTWVVPEPPKQTQPEPPKTTMLPASANGPAEPTTSPPNRKAQYEELLQKNPFYAHAFYKQHAREIYPDK
jgi:hypothetical protein